MQNRRKKIWEWIAGIVGGIIVVAVVGINLVPMSASDKKIKKIELPQGAQGRIEHFDVYGREMRSFVINHCEREDSLTIIMAHGAPGSLDAWKGLFIKPKLLKKAQIVAYDRPGYGDAKRGGAMPSIESQAEALYQLVQRYDSQKVVLVGHSYGGPIIAKVAAMYPDKIDAIMMLAPVVDPDNEQEFWYAKITQWKLLRWMIPSALKVAGDEKMNHAAELAKMKNDWANIKCPIVQIHGDSDFLAPPSNIDFTNANVDATQLNMIVIPEGNHFIPFSRTDMVEEELLKLIDKL